MNYEAKAASMWLNMSKNEKAGVRCGMFPHGKMKEAEAEGYDGHKLCCALMDQAQKKRGDDLMTVMDDALANLEREYQKKRAELIARYELLDQLPAGIVVLPKIFFPGNKARPWDMRVQAQFNFNRHGDMTGKHIEEPKLKSFPGVQRISYGGFGLASYDVRCFWTLEDFKKVVLA